MGEIKGNNETSKRMSDARMSIAQHSVFFSALLFRLEYIEKEVGTMATDGRRLFYDPGFVEKLNNNEIKGVIVHEILHCCYNHFERIGIRDRRIWNIACDFAINPIVIESGYQLPEGALIDEKYTGKTAEWIYNDLIEKGERMPNFQSIGDVIPPPPGSEDAQDGSEQLATDWERYVIHAAQEAQKGNDKVPADLERFIGEICKPKINWKDALRRFVQMQSKSDYTWKMPNTRYISQGMYLPSMQSESMPPMVVAVDTSGSVGPSELSAFSAEIQSIADEVKPERVVVIYCDARINAVEEYYPGDFIELKPKGGGGTSFVPVFEWISKQSDEFSCCVYLTDLYGNFPSSEILPTIWAATSDQPVPFGDVVRLEVGE